MVGVVGCFLVALCDTDSHIHKRVEMTTPGFERGIYNEGKCIIVVQAESLETLKSMICLHQLHIHCISIPLTTL